jgi:hypothetical protein
VIMNYRFGGEDKVGSDVRGGESPDSPPTALADC